MDLKVSDFGHYPETHRQEKKLSDCYSRPCALDVGYDRRLEKRGIPDRDVIRMS